MTKRKQAAEPYRDDWTSFGHAQDLHPLRFTDGKKTYTFWGETSEEAEQYARAWSRKRKIKLERVQE